MIQVRKKKKITDFLNVKSLKIFDSLIKNCDYVILLFSIFMILLYIMGNYHNFLDKTQFLILNVLAVSSLLLTILASITLLENIIYIFYAESKRKCIFSIIFSLLCIIISVFFIFYATIVSRLSLGF